MEDPVQQALSDLGELRGRLTTEFLRLPAPGPLRDALQEIDKMAGRVENEIKAIAPGQRIFLTFKETLTFLNVSHQTLYKMMGQGLPSHKVGRQRAFFPEEIIKWARKQ